ncbi:MAG TPA: hypothetical protein VGA36_10510 [Nitriliruptorales bacterium]
MSKRMFTMFGLAAVTATLTTMPVGAAFAEPAASASCMGHEAAAISPPGSSDEFPGGMPEFGAIVSEAFPGVPRGQVISFFATLHEGSHEGCDEAVE